MVSPAGEGLSAAVARLRDEADELPLPLGLPGADEDRRTRTELVAQLDDYVLPRLRHPEAPLLAVVGGSTGAGRSTLVNSLVGREVSPAGVLRPTTRVPVLVCRAADRRWFSGTRVLPGLRRIARPTRTPGQGPALVLQVDDRVPEGLAVLDIPDIDSIDDTNRALAVRLLGAADVWLFVTTAARYADAVPWHLLRIAGDRATEIAIVLNRVPDGDLDEVRPHFEALLASTGLGSVPLFALPETTLVRRMLTRDQVAPVRNWLYDRATDAGTRDAAVRRTLGGVLGSLPERARVLGMGAVRQHEAAGALAVCVDRAYAAARRHVDSALCGGSVLTGDVLAHWRAWVSAGLPDSGAAAMEAVLVEGVETLFRDVAERAAGLTSRCWLDRPGGSALVGDGTPANAPRPGDTEAAEGGTEAEATAAARAAAAWRNGAAARVPDGMSRSRLTKVLLMTAALADDAGDIDGIGGGGERGGNSGAVGGAAPGTTTEGTAAAGPTGEARGANDAGTQARAALPPALGHEVVPLRASVRGLAAELLDAQRDLHMRAVTALRTKPGDGLREAMAATANTVAADTARRRAAG
ncbi:ATP-binding protein [Yinghuangia sp. YIM S09857]|uniref:ATP-binding protein n=1 Tax=Yinghuangia sp. YIM S09857 TaxID=3436929 RepID=UPI003F532877